MMARKPVRPGFRKPSCWRKCGEGFSYRLDHIAIGDHLCLRRNGTVESILTHYELASKSKSSLPSFRFRGAMKWIEYATLDGVDPRIGSESYDVALDILPAMFWTEGRASMKLQTLQKAPRLACEPDARRDGGHWHCLLFHHSLFLSPPLCTPQTRPRRARDTPRHDPPPVAAPRLPPAPLSLSRSASFRRLHCCSWL